VWYTSNHKKKSEPINSDPEKSPAVICQPPKSELFVNKQREITETSGKNGTPNQALPARFFKKSEAGPNVRRKGLRRDIQPVVLQQPKDQPDQFSGS